MYDLSVCSQEKKRGKSLPLPIFVYLWWLLIPLLSHNLVKFVLTKLDVHELLPARSILLYPPSHSSDYVPDDWLQVVVTPFSYTHLPAEISNSEKNTARKITKGYYETLSRWAGFSKTGLWTWKQYGSHQAHRLAYANLWNANSDVASWAPTRCMTCSEGVPWRLSA